MEYRKILNTDLELSVITFGAWAAGSWMWGKTDKNEAIHAIRAGYNAGMTSIDTAPIYGQGESEEIVAEAIKEIRRDKIQILTKFGMRWNLAKGALAFKTKNNLGEPIDVYKYAGKDSVIKECEDSLRRLKTDYIDLYQIHWHDETTPFAETYEAVAKLIQQGKVRYAGVCNYTAKWFNEANKILNLVSNQVPYSMVNRNIEEETVPYCIQHNKSIIAYSPMERGLLTGKLNEHSTFAEGDHRATHPSFTPQNIVRVNKFLDKLKPLAESKNASLSQLVLRWTIEQPGITIALAGARNATQSVQNAKAADVKLTEEEIKFINAELNKM